MPEFVATAIDEMIDWLTGVNDPPATGTRYLTTYNGDPQGAGTENINTLNGSPNRIAITSSMAASSGGTGSSDTDIVISASAAGAVTVDYVALFDAQTGGNLLASTSVTSKSIGIGDSLSVPSGNLSFTIT